MEMQLCYSTTCFGTEKKPDDLLRWLEIIRASGVNTVEISRKHHDLAGRAGRIDALGVKVWSVHGTLGIEAIAAGEEQCRNAVAAEIARMEDAAAFAPCPYVIHYLDRFKDPAYGRRFRSVIEQLIRANADFGFTLAIETAPYKPRENERYPDSLEIAAFVRSFADEKVKMTLDINHSNLHEDILTVCRNCRGMIENIHVSDNHGVYEEHLVPGAGNIQFRPVMEELRGCGYVGPCNLELHLPEIPDKTVLRRINNAVRNLLS